MQSADTFSTRTAAASFEVRLARFPARRMAGKQHVIGYREAGAGHRSTPPVVLLHGIGSGAASWVQQFEALEGSRRILAWDAPGYGESTCVAPASPVAADYAAALADWLDALEVERCVLVGHSLGAIIAGAFAGEYPTRVTGLLLLSPAPGYGAASAEERESKRAARLALLAELGAAGLAAKRSANLLSEHASEAALDWVRWNMARIVPRGYAQATNLLANAELVTDLARFQGRAAVAVGAEDTITPPAACKRIARAMGVGLNVVPCAGHAGYVEAPEAYTAIIDAFCRANAK
jgi:pimeloyl-ACP methyl ester carboxylesterase